jgi:3',5'-cyclic-AMP phosphodiesterase
MLIAHLTDTHVTAPGAMLGGRIDSGANLSRAVERLLALDASPDCVVMTGDLTDSGTPESYAALRHHLARLSMPVYAIPGNHDRREPMRQAFADCAWMPPEPGSPLCYEVELGPFTLIALDSLVEGKDYGALGARQLDWLRDRLVRASRRRVLVMVHHPPVNSGIAVMDAMKLQDAGPLGELMVAHPNVERILCGHLHRSMHLRWRGTLVSVPSSTVEQLHLAFDRHAPLGTICEPPGLQLHYDDPTDGLVSHAVPVGDFAGPYIYD